MSVNSNPETSRKSPHPGYPVRILGRFAMHPKEVLTRGAVPTTDQIVEVACEAVKFTQKASSYPGAIIAGTHITAAPESAKNGSLFLPISSEGKARSYDLFRHLLTDLSAVDKAEGVGVYVTSDKKKAAAADVHEIGVVLCDSSANRLSDTVMDRGSVDELSDPQRQQLGDLLTAIATQADIAYGSKLLKLAR